LQAGGHRFDPGHVHQLYFVRFFNLRRNLQRLARRDFWSTWSNKLWNGESVADTFGLHEAYFQFLVKVRVDFRHRLRLVGHQKLLMSSEQRAPRSHVLRKRLKRGEVHQCRGTPLSSITRYFYRLARCRTPDDVVFGPVPYHAYFVACGALLKIDGLPEYDKAIRKYLDHPHRQARWWASHALKTEEPAT